MSEQHNVTERDDKPFVYSRGTRYNFTIFPETEEFLEQCVMYTVTAQYRGRGKWAVVHNGKALSISGSWDYEPRSSERGEQWLKEHRFDRMTAMRLAYENAFTITVANRTAVDVLNAMKEEAPKL